MVMDNLKYKNFGKPSVISESKFPQKKPGSFLIYLILIVATLSLMMNS